MILFAGILALELMGDGIALLLGIEALRSRPSVHQPSPGQDATLLFRAEELGFSTSSYENAESLAFRLHQDVALVTVQTLPTTYAPSK